MYEYEPAWKQKEVVYERIMDSFNSFKDPQVNETIFLNTYLKNISVVCRNIINCIINILSTVHSNFLLHPFYKINSVVVQFIKAKLFSNFQIVSLLKIYYCIYLSI